MARIILLANLNCDRILKLDSPLVSGGRFHYQDMGRRLGGGGANTGLALKFANHHVALVSQVGNDETADWLLAQASVAGLDCQLLQRNSLSTPELILLMTPDGERTIVRPSRPDFVLNQAPDFSTWHALYINSSAIHCEKWAQQALTDCLVVAQLSKDQQPRPCHVLITSKSDMSGRLEESATANDYWLYAQKIAGNSLRYFIITDGEQGAILYANDSHQYVNAVSANVVDTTGAGDTYAAGVIDALLGNKNIIEAMQQGAQWAAIAVATESSIPGKKLQQFIENKE